MQDGTNSMCLADISIQRLTCSVFFSSFGCMCARLNFVAEITRNPIKIITIPDDALVRSIEKLSDRVIVISDTPDVPVIINTTPVNIIIKPTNRPIKAFVDSLFTNFLSWSLLVDGSTIDEHIRSSGFFFSHHSLR